MIKALLIEADPTTRDIIKTGLEQFQAFEIDLSDDAWGVEMAREKTYDLILVNLELPDGADGITVSKQIREFDKDCEIVLITRGKSSRLLTKEKAAQNIFSLLSCPIDARLSRT